MFGVNLTKNKYLIGFGVGLLVFSLPILAVMDSLSYQNIPTLSPYGSYQATGSSYNFILTLFFIVIAVILFIILIFMCNQENKSIVMADIEIANCGKQSPIIGRTENITGTMTPGTSTTSVVNVTST